MTIGLAILGIYSHQACSPTIPAMVQDSGNRRIEISWAACPRWATSGSSDLVDVVEQLNHRWAVLMVDVQGSGPSGRRLASTLMHMARECLAAGMTVDTSVLAVHQHLFAVRQGKVGASIHACVVDAQAGVAHLAGLGPLGVATTGASGDGWRIDKLQAPAAGFERDVEVLTVDCSLTPRQQLILANDGVTHQQDGLAVLLASSPFDQGGHIESARQLLDEAIARESGRPRSDMAVALISFDEEPAAEDRVLHARISIPVRTGRCDP